MTDAHAVHVKTRFSSRSGRVSSTKPAAAKRINDVTRATSKSLVVTPRPQPVKRVAPVLIKPSRRVTGVMDMKSTPHGHVKAHKQQPARTLMRTAVKRPKPSLRRQAHAQTRTDVLVKTPNLSVAPKLSIATIDEQRLQRAAHVAKSKFIRRFAPDQASWFRQQVSTPAPEQAAVTASTNHVPAPSAGKKNRSMDIFQRALATATTHEQPPVSHKRQAHKASHKPKVHHRLTSVVAISLAVVVMAGFFAYQNKASITLRFASAKAGFHATLPTYQPTGFAAGKFHYSAGQVAVQYAKPGTSRNYTVSQKRTSLTNQSVLTASIMPKGSSYQTLQQGESTIYIYGNGSAAWVNKGLFYQISSDGNLTTADIVSIATSV